MWEYMPGSGPIIKAFVTFKKILYPSGILKDLSSKVNKHGIKKVKTVGSDRMWVCIRPALSWFREANLDQNGFVYTVYKKGVSNSCVKY